jgi:hypothetical protein
MSDPSGDGGSIAHTRSVMQLTLYLRTFPVTGAPVGVSFTSGAAGQRHTFTAGGRVYEAQYREFHVVAPDGAKLDLLHGVLVWSGDEGSVKSTAREVYELAKSRTCGFRTGR